MTSSNSSTHFVPDPLWAPRDKAFAQKALEAEEAPFRPLGLAACIPAPREEGSEAEGTAAAEVLEEAESPPLSEALEAMLEEAREEARRAGEEAGDARGYARGVAEGEARGQEAGYAEGVIAGRAEAEAAQAELLTRLDTISHALDNAQEPLSEQMEAFRRLTLHLVETVLRRSLGSGEDFLSPLVERALEALDERDAGALTVALNPSDYSALGEALGLRFKDLKFSEDGEVPLGSVRLQAGATVIDDFIAQRLETLARELLGEQQGWRPERLAEPLTPKARTLDDVAEAEWSPINEDETPATELPQDHDESPSPDSTSEDAPLP